LRSRRKNLSKEGQQEIPGNREQEILEEIPVQVKHRVIDDLEDQRINKGHSENYFGDYRDFWWNREFLDMTAQRLELNSMSSMLDVGCGNGHWTRILAPYLEKHASITAVDSDPRWFQENKELEEFFDNSSQSFELKEGNAQRLPFQDNSFDLVTCQTLLIHVPEPAKAISEMKRVVKP
jgi:SAM-dependent methyltransferase